MLGALLAIPGLVPLLQDLVKAVAVARTEDRRLGAARAGADAAQARYQAELERRLLERRVALDDPAAVREQLRQYRARRLGAGRRA